MSKRPLAIAAATLLLLITGCTPSSKNPLSDPKDAKVDDALLGVWCHESESDLCFYHVAPSKQDIHSYDIVSVRHDFIDGITESRFRAFTTELGETKILNILEIADEKKGLKYVFLKYLLNKDGVLELSMLQSEPFSQAIKDKKLTGKVIKGGDFPDDVELTDSSENLLTFLRQVKLAEAFSEKPSLSLKKLHGAPEFNNPNAPSKKKADEKK